MGDHEYAVEQPPVADETMVDGSLEDLKKEMPSAEHVGIVNGSIMELPEGGLDEQQVATDEIPEEERLWGVVKANPADFNAWIALIQETEKLVNIVKIRKVYDAFLGEFPLCYGYWKKYADHEAQLGAVEKIVEVYERAVGAVTYSVDIWMHYCAYAMEKFENPEDTRRLFERGLEYVGTDYLSHLLWDKYIDFEYSQEEFSRLALIYSRVLQIPLQQLDRYHASFKQVASSRPLVELRTPEENAEAAALAATALEPVPIEDKGADGPPGDEEGSKVEKPIGLTEADDLASYIAIRDVLYRKAKEADVRIRDYETAIRRPYFHVKPLDDTQLGNWHRYLDLVEKDGDFDKIVKLYERCLIACANYPEYWIRYVQRMELDESLDRAVNALSRAADVFVKRRPEIHLFSARFKELQGDVPGARAEYDLLNSELSPGLLEAIVKYANLEHRQGNLEAACQIYESSIDVEKAKEESRSLPLLVIQYVRFLDQVAGKTEKAREVLAAALEHTPGSKVLWEAAIHFESFRNGEKQVQRVDALVEQATAPQRLDGTPGLPASDREEISSVFLEFVDLYGDAELIRKADFRHRQLFPPRKTFNDSKKRPSPDSGLSDRAKVHKPYSGTHTVASPAPLPPAYANGQAQWGTNYAPQTYAQQPQGWQQPPPQQAPPQQWNPGYQQGGYGGYTGYSGYGPPQQQPPPPQQQPAYGGYGQGYPPQQEVNGWNAGVW
eukprot:TRINITY_DN2206_c0_g2_i2.p1 TRINITY_DN2206_c0_g2~~TRINITY_DN2206_c0_g2_i2.p1  ORF type:complete len:724 (+),score=173.25 TRINITY_DN2206_c0_g2_i2:90-2261(+)